MNTLKYTQLVDFKGDDYKSKVTKDSEEAQQLIENEFEFVFTLQTQILYLEWKQRPIINLLYEKLGKT